MAEYDHEKSKGSESLPSDGKADESKRVQNSTEKLSVEEQRKSKISSFKLNLNLDDYPDPDTASAPPEDGKQAEDEATEPVHTEPQADEDDDNSLDVAEDQSDTVSETKSGASAKHAAKHKKGKKSESRSYLKVIAYVTAILLASGCLTIFAIVSMLDITGVKKSNLKVDVDIPTGAGTTQVAKILHKNKLIDYPSVFRLFSKIKHYDGKYQPGTFTLSANMGYDDIMQEIITAPERETVKIVIPEGYTIDKIAKMLDENEVCKKSEFYTALVDEEFNYDFLSTVPSKDKARSEGRVYRLEGYLFPDTYLFNKNCSATTVINKMLKNFGSKLDPDLRAAAKSSGMSMDEVVTFASIVQGEAASEKDMPGVSRVLHNRLNDKANYPKLQCDSTSLYASKLLAPLTGSVPITDTAYNTYKRNGLPVGPINNPSIEAIKATLIPSNDTTIMKCYFFANDHDRNTYYSKTLAEHERICKKYGIGMYG